MELIKSRAQGFTFKLAETDDDIGDDTDQKKKLRGVVCCMDDSHYAPCAATGSYLENIFVWIWRNGRDVCGIEGIVCGERIDMYKFVADFIGESAHGRSLKKM